jgi:hypothetical protein
LDERRGPAVDLAGGHDGTYTPGVIRASPGLITGDPDRAAAFNGSKGSINIPVAGDLGIADHLSLELWLTAGSTNNRGLLGRFNSYYLSTDPAGHFAAAVYSGGRLQLATSPQRAIGVKFRPPKVPSISYGATAFFVSVMIALALASLGWILAHRGGPGSRAADGPATQRER